MHSPELADEHLGIDVHRVDDQIHQTAGLGLILDRLQALHFDRIQVEMGNRLGFMGGVDGLDTGQQQQAC